MKPRKFLQFIRLGLIPAASLIVTTETQATSFYWDTNSTTAGLGNSAGTWGAAPAGSAFLSTIGTLQARGIIDGVNATPATATTAAADTIYFGTVNLALGSTASSISIASGGVNIQTIVFGQGQGSQGVTLGGSGTITLGANANIVSNNSGTNIISTVLVGTPTNGLKVTGPGALVLTGANTYTGGTTINAGGTLQVGNGTTGSLTSQALTFNNGGGIFNVKALSAGSTQGMAALTFANTTGEGTVQSTYGTSGNAVLSFSSLATRGFGSTGNFVTSGGTNGTTNKITISGATAGTLLDKGLFFGGSSYAGYDSGGFVRAFGAGDTNYLAAPTGATIGASTSSSNVEVTGNITAQNSAATNTINLGANSIAMTGTGQVLQANGILSSGSSSATIGGGTNSQLKSTTGNGELVIRVNGSTDVLTISSNIIGNGTSSLTKSGAGQLILSGANTYSNTTIINAGTLALSGGSAIVDSGSVVLANAAGAVLQLNNNETISALTGGGFSGGNVNVQGNTLTIGATSAFNGQLIGTSAGGVKVTAGTLTLANPNSFAGTLTVGTGAALSFTEGNPATVSSLIVSSGGAINLNSGSTLNISPTPQPTLGQIGNQAAIFYTVDNNISVATGAAAANLTFGGLNDTKFKFSGTVTGSSIAATPTTLSITTPSAQGRQEILFSNVISDGSGGALGITANLNSNTGGSGSWLNLQAANTFTGPISVTNSGTALNWLVIGGERTSATAVITGSGYIGNGNYTNTIGLAANMWAAARMAHEMGDLKSACPNRRYLGEA